MKWYSTIGVPIAICIFLYCQNVASLYCYRCLNIDCPEKEKECQQTKKFLLSELSQLYYFEGDLHPCPPLNDTFTWTIMQISESDTPCEEEKKNQATCTLGKIQVNLTDADGNFQGHHHAVVFGCAKRKLLERTGALKRSNCDYLVQKQRDNGTVRRSAEIEHCRQLETMCHHRDFCINWRKSEVKIWPNVGVKSSFNWSGFGWVVGIAGSLTLLGCFMAPFFLEKGSKTAPESKEGVEKGDTYTPLDPEELQVA